VSSKLKRYTLDEDNFIRNNTDLSILDVATALGRSFNSVASRAKVLGVHFRKPIAYSSRNGYYVRREYASGKTRREVYKHIEVMENHIGRAIVKPEMVHHIDCNKLNNDIDNLFLCSNWSEHFKIHRSVEKLLPYLIEQNIVYFNRATKTYELKEGIEC
jgi:hypothetical protein